MISPKSRPPGCRADRAGHESFPLVLPGPLVVCVEEELAVDGVCDVSLERADCLPLGLALGHLALEVGPTLRVGLADLTDGHHVDGVIELPVAATAQTVDGAPPGGKLDGCHAGIRSELVPAGESADVTGVAN